MQHNPGVFILVHVMVLCVHLFPKHASEAVVVNNCTGSVHSVRSCEEITYEQVYNILAKSENSYNIESALYPPKSPSSVRVLVNIYGPNKTDLSTPAAKYTWSISCLYAALPARVLEFWSLGAIQVNRRTQKLNITISISCCDMTKGILKKHIEDALAALEDLAIKPTLRDPRLNSAECVLEGHESDIFATGQSWRIIVVLVCSTIFSVLGGTFLFAFAWQHMEKQTNIVQNTMDFVCIFSAILFIGILIAEKAVVHVHDEERVPDYFKIIVPLLVLYSITFFVFIWWYSFISFPKCEWKALKLVFYMVSANLAAYHLCWVVVGLTLNPIWGLFYLLGICLIVGVFSFYVYQYNYHTRPRESVNDKAPEEGKGDSDTSDTDDDTCDTYHYRPISRLQSLYWSVSCIVATICLLAVAVFSGQLYNGKETADQFFKDIVGYLLPVCFAWLCWKSNSKRNCKKKKRKKKKKREEKKKNSSNTSPQTQPFKINSEVYVQELGGNLTTGLNEGSYEL